ncbi:hypothetical protein DICPUDRAFT_38971 [Dictyostelium purpureum]|uniref:Dynein light chain n=1 Tax=Dictyostelium purpureum TaxID=5786 RepID=F0ZVG5_DICPU|nr:uncharacterized protein DICPUDRAFT_38971 [Dictyostelium purpureum]EGC32061.1 hypothetical protein DICPUDRAFT_38971 [Dictyostelium purpureum]|eukprot:XP_003291415.1 hypothetical protein DICPUDRAFT_38971 [Dictyostelium purpureum]
MSNKFNITIKSVDMQEFMQQDATELAIKLLEEQTPHKDIATIIKKEFDKKYLGNWHCIVGKSFASFVTHETKSYIYFNINDNSILLFKSG